MGMLDSLGRSIQIFFLRITGQVDKANKIAMKDPVVIRAVYDEEAKKIAAGLNQAADAASTVIHEQEKLKGALTRKREEHSRSERIMQGALAAAKKRSAELQGQGKTAEDIKVDPDFVRHQTAYVDAQSTVNERKQFIAQLERDIAGYDKQLEATKVAMLKLQREQGKLKGEGAEMAMRLIAAQNRERIAALTAGLKLDDSTGQLRQDIRDLVGEAEAKARVTEELAGTSAEDAEEQYLAQAETSVAMDEFASLVGLAEQVETKTRAPDAPAAAAEKLS